ncbi:hypothetical protein [Arthrobacter sp. HLT1-20]
MGYTLTAQSAPGGTFQFVSEIGRKVLAPVIVKARPDTRDDMEDFGRHYLLEFGVRPAGYFGLERLTIAADEGALAIGSADLRTVRLGELAGMALRFLSMPNVSWDHGESIEVKFFELTDEEFEDAYIQGGANEHDAKYLPALGMYEGKLDVRPEWRAELRALGPSHERVAKTVAAIYRDAERNGEPPNKAIENLLGLASSTASHWIKLSRQAGELAPARRKARAERK